MDAYKAILRHYHTKAQGKANAYTVGVAKTLLQVARFHARVASEVLAQLKHHASKLAAIPFDLTPKNRALLMQLESKALRARLVFLPDD
jgi:hypothetical protein